MEHISGMQSIKELYRIGRDRQAQTFENIPIKIIFNMTKGNLPHQNTMEIAAFKDNTEVYRKTFLSVGGGAVEVLGENANQPKVIYNEKNFLKLSVTMKCTA